jgi:hypothetical protein
MLAISKKAFMARCKRLPASVFLTLLLVLLYSCQKKAINDSPNCRCVAYVIDSINYKGKILKTDTAISWPQVCDTELNRFLVTSRAYQPICGRPNCYLRLVIWK